MAPTEITDPVFKKLLDDAEKEAVRVAEEAKRNYIAQLDSAGEVSTNFASVLREVERQYMEVIRKQGDALYHSPDRPSDYADQHNQAEMQLKAMLAEKAKAYADDFARERELRKIVQTATYGVVPEPIMPAPQMAELHGESIEGFANRRLKELATEIAQLTRHIEKTDYSNPNTYQENRNLVDALNEKILGFEEELSKRAKEENVGISVTDKFEQFRESTQAIDNRIKERNNEQKLVDANKEAKKEIAKIAQELRGYLYGPTVPLPTDMKATKTTQKQAKIFGKEFAFPMFKSKNRNPIAEKLLQECEKALKEENPVKFQQAFNQLNQNLASEANKMKNEKFQIKSSKLQSVCNEGSRKLNLIDIEHPNMGFKRGNLDITPERKMGIKRN